MHEPVLLNEVIKILKPKPGENFIDATINGGGHARAILDKIVPGGKLLGIEWDRKVIEDLKFKIENWKSKAGLILINDSYVNLKDIVIGNDFQHFNGILFDLGMSNWHLEESGKGFSFLRDEPLDMRYDASGDTLTASEVVNQYTQTELERIIRTYGEEPFASSISTAVVKVRRERPIATTVQLVEVIRNAVPFWYRRRRTHWATKTFQALRIETNHELENVEKGLKQAIDLAPAGCRIAVITFHSLEDRIVKNVFRENAQAGILALVSKKPILVSFAERVQNPKARSAKLRSAVTIVART